MNHPFNPPDNPNLNSDIFVKVDYNNIDVSKYYYLLHHIMNFQKVKIIQKNEQKLSMEIINEDNTVGETIELASQQVLSGLDSFYILDPDYIAQGQQGGRKKKYHKKSKKTHKKSKKSKRRKTGKHKK
jgi:hypothetical protein